MQASPSIVTRYITGAIATLSLLYSFPLQAQLIPDTSLGTESSIVQFVNANRQDITGGALRGSNLFHSFQDFNVAQDRSVYFANPAVVENILTRVTGNNISNIFGTLGVDGNANLFLINPNGIYFGKDARLDISGSFTASTSDKIRLGENAWFGINTPPEELLTIKPETSFNYALQNYLGNITSTGQIQTGGDLNLQAQNLFLSGQIGAQGNLNLQAIDTVQMRDSVDNPLQLVSGQNLLVEGLDTVDIFALNHPDSGLWSGGDMVLRSANDVGGDAHFWSGGNFNIESLDQTLGNIWSPHDPIIRSKGNVSFNYYWGSSLHIIAGGSVTINTARINTPETGRLIEQGKDIDFIKETVTLSDGSLLKIDGSTRPTLDVRAGVLPEYIGKIGFTGIDLYNPLTYKGYDWFVYNDMPNPQPIDKPTSANIKIGDIWIPAADGLVFLTNQYHPNQLAGKITIDPSTGYWGYGIDVGTKYSDFNGDGGDIAFDSRGDINVSGVIDTLSYKNGGDLFFNALGDINIHQSPFIRTVGIERKSGNITFKSEGNINLSQNISLQASGTKKAGNILFDSKNSINLDKSVAFDNSAIDLHNFVKVFPIHTYFTNGGNLALFAKKDISIDSGSSISTNGLLGGNIEFASEGNIIVKDSFLSSSSFTQEENLYGGTIKFSANSVAISDGSHVSIGSYGIATSGLIKIIANKAIYLEGNDTYGLGSVVENQVNTVGDSGGIEINTGSLFISEGGQISSGTLGTGNAGLIKITAADTIALSGEYQAGMKSVSSSIISTTSSESEGDSLGIEIKTGSLSLDGGAIISSSSLGKGNSGLIKIYADNTINLAGSIKSGSSSAILSFSSGNGNAGDINIKTDSLFLKNGSEISASSIGTGHTGSIQINAIDKISLSGENNLGSGSSIANEIFSAKLVESKNINIRTNSLFLYDGSQISSSTNGKGDAGLIDINATDTVLISGKSSKDVHSAIVSEVSTDAKGNSLGIKIRANSLNLDDEAGISALTEGQGNAGNIYIVGNNVNIVNGSQILTKTQTNYPAGHIVFDIVNSTTLKGKNSGLFAESTSGGIAGNIFVNTPNLNILDGARISAFTSGSGNAGSIKLTVANDILLDGINTGVFANTSPNSQGNGGTITIDPTYTTIRNGAGIGVNSQGNGKGGDILLTSDNLLLDNNAFISAETFSSDGGNINLNLADFLILKNGSNITATAGTLGTAGNGGNITITAPWIIAFSNQDNNIIANAFNGKGGNINITTNALLGITFTGKNIPVRNDISASSQFGLDGSVLINTPAVDPASGLTELPKNLVDASNLIGKNTCALENQKIAGGSSFVVKGKGGLPDMPTGNLLSRTASVDYIGDPNNVQALSADEAQSEDNSVNEKLAIAQSWQRLPDGTIQLVERSPQPQPEESILQHPNCI